MAIKPGERRLEILQTLQDALKPPVDMDSWVPAI